MNFLNPFIYMKKNHLLLLLCFFGVSSLFAQSRLEIGIDFKVGDSAIDEQYSNNSDESSETISIEEQIIVNETQEKEMLVVDEVEEWTQQLYLKSNTVGLALLISNLHVEMDLAPHWSATLPLYYSAWDYFKHDLKFRTFKMQPELRYWIKDNDGLFVGAHLTMAYYNVAWKKDYRIQDKNRNTPAFGGGLSVGYRLPISKNNRWKMEFALGAGGYDIHYDKFHNTRNGYMVETVKDTYWGIDQIAVTVAYMFDVKTVLR